MIIILRYAFVIFSLFVTGMVFFNVGADYINQNALIFWFPIYIAGSFYFILRAMQEMVTQIRLDRSLTVSSELNDLIREVHSINRYLKSMNNRDMDREQREKIKAGYYEDI